MRRIPRRFLLSLLALAIAACADGVQGPPLGPDAAPLDAEPTAAPTFVVRQLGLPDGATSGVARDINDNGVVVGHAMTVTGNQSFRWNGSFALLPTVPGWAGVSVAGVNNTGMMVGIAFTGAQTSPAVWTEDGAIVQELKGFDPNGANWANDVNDAGIVVGFGTIPGHPSPVSYRWTANGGLRVLPIEGGWSMALRVNRSGQVVGVAIDTSGVQRIVIWSPSGIPEFLPVPVGFAIPFPFGINDLGAIVGSILQNGLPGVPRAFRWSTSQGFELLPTPTGWVGTTANDIDQQGRAFGSAFIANTGLRIPVMWTPDGSVHLLPDASAANSLGPLRVNRCGRGAGSAPSPTTWTVWTTEC